MKLFSPRNASLGPTGKGRLQFDGRDAVEVQQMLEARERNGGDPVIIALDEPAGALFKLLHEDGIQVVADNLYVNAEAAGTIPGAYLKPAPHGERRETVELTREEEEFIKHGKADLIAITRAQVGRTPGDDEEHAEAVTALTAGPVPDILVGTSNDAEAIALASGEGVSTAPSLSTTSVPTPVQMPVAMPKDPPVQPLVGGAAATERARVRISKKTDPAKTTEPAPQGSPLADAATTDADGDADDDTLRNTDGADIGTPKVSR